MSRRSRWAYAAALSTAFIIAMAGCGSSTITADEAAAADADAASSTVVSVPETVTSAADTTEAPASDDGTEAPPDEETDDGSSGGGDGDDDGSCIEGDWTVSEEELNSYYSELGAATGVPMRATGTARIRFIDLQFVYDAVFELEMDIEGQPTVANADGVATGSYVFQDGIISTELAANSLSIVVNVGGFEIDAGEFGNDLLTSFPINDAPYNCDGPTIFFETGGAERHPVVLTPYVG